MFLCCFFGCLQLQSIDKLIKKLEASIGDVDESSIQSSKIEAKIAFLRKERGDICFENVEVIKDHNNELTLLHLFRTFVSSV